ncbi:hypothetical protein ABIB17_003584 [Arthrobacter sp. UYEF6]
MGKVFSRHQRDQQLSKRMKLAGHIGLALLMVATGAILMWVFVLGKSI